MKKIRLSGKYAKGTNEFAFVDDNDFESLSKYRWKAKPNASKSHFYAIRTGIKNGKSFDIRMHREVLNVKPGEKCDVFHLNNNSLDNRECNLKKGTRSDTIRNIGFKMVEGKCIFCGNVFNRKVMKNVSKILYCSTTCKKKSGHKKYKSKQNDVVIHEKHCKRCGKFFKTKSIRQIFCTEKCRYEHKNRIKKRNIINGECLKCGKKFVTHIPTKKYCSRRCYKIDHYEYKVYNHKCEWCKKVFKSKRYNTRFCSNKCSSISNYYKNNPKNL